MATFFELSEDHLLKQKLECTLSLLQQIISHKNSVKKLTHHPITDWHEWFSTEVASDMVTEGTLLINEKRAKSFQMILKIKRKPKLTDLICEYNILSTRICESHVEASLRAKYLDSTRSSFAEFNSDEISMIKKLRSLK